MAVGTARTAVAVVMGLVVTAAALLSPAASGDWDDDEGTSAAGSVRRLPAPYICPGGAGRSGRTKRTQSLSAHFVSSSACRGGGGRGVVCSEGAGGHQGGAG